MTLPAQSKFYLHIKNFREFILRKNFKKFLVCRSKLSIVLQAFEFNLRQYILMVYAHEVQPAAVGSIRI